MPRKGKKKAVSGRPSEKSGGVPPLAGIKCCCEGTRYVIGVDPGPVNCGIVTVVCVPGEMPRVLEARTENLQAQGSANKRDIVTEMSACLGYAFLVCDLHNDRNGMAGGGDIILAVEQQFRGKANFVIEAGAMGWALGRSDTHLVRCVVRDVKLAMGLPASSGSHAANKRDMVLQVVEHFGANGLPRLCSEWKNVHRSVKDAESVSHMADAFACAMYAIHRLGIAK